MKAKYDVIGIDYNLTRKADPYLVSRFLVLLNPNPKGQYLDIGCGTGNYTSEFQKKGFSFIGIDPSTEMLKAAKLQNEFIDFRIGTSEQTDLDDVTMDGITISLSVHHWPDLERSFKELCRVLKEDGNMVLFTSAPEQMEGYWLNHYFPKTLQASKRQMPSIENIILAMEAGGLEITGSEYYSVKPDIHDLFLYSGKHDPERYFNEQFRKGISSFSDLGIVEEIESGLQQLRADIITGKVKEVMKAYENNRGDYLYITACKN